MELPDIPEPILKELLDLPLTDAEERGDFAFHLLDDEYLKRTWVEHRRALLAIWLEDHPGTRPQIWWRLDAPREPPGTRPGCYDDGKLELPRERLGGVGTPELEVFNVATDYWLGIPRSWVEAEDVELYSGTAKDVHGEIIMPEYIGNDFRGVAIDPADPPIYESQAAYLKRHGLFLPGEERRLPADAYAPELVLS